MNGLRGLEDDQETSHGFPDGVFPEEHEKFLSDLFLIVSHVVRRDLIRLIGGWEKISFTDLINETKLTPGTFYYHLKKMPELVKQGEDKRYSLTLKGKMAYDLLEHGENQVLLFATNQEYFNQQTKKISSPFFQRLFKEIRFTPRFTMEMTGLIILQIIFTNLAEIGFLILLFNGSLYFDPLITILEVFFSVILIWMFFETYFIISRGRKSKQKVHQLLSMELLLSVPVCLSPLFLVPVLILISEYFFSALGTNDFLFPFLAVILQLISGYFFLEAIQVTKSAKFTEAIIPVFIVLYGSSLISMALA